MTENEAIEHAREYIKYLNYSGWEKDFDAIQKLIVATEELQKIKKVIEKFPLDCGNTVEDVKEIWHQLSTYLRIGEVEEFMSLKECFGHTAPKSRGKAIYDKAIDDFYDEALNFEDYIEPINEDNGVLVYSGKDITNMIVTIAKEMKGENNNE